MNISKGSVAIILQNLALLRTYKYRLNLLKVAQRNLKKSFKTRYLKTGYVKLSPIDLKDSVLCT